MAQIQKPIELKNSQNFQEIKKNKISKQREYFLDMMTGRFKYNSTSYNSDTLKPDLIISLQLPTTTTLHVSQIAHISDILSVPSQVMRRAYEQAKENVIKKMEQNKQLNDSTNLKLRYQYSIQQTSKQESKLKQLNYFNDILEQEFTHIKCQNQFNGLQDCFTIIFNTIVYVLQHDCGFKVKSFLLKNKKKQPKLFLFLFSRTDNLLKLANQYRIKKQVPYQFYDFFLNDPSTSDKRPIRFNSELQKFYHGTNREKTLQRYFKAKGLKREEIVEQKSLTNQEVINYLDYLDLMYQIMEKFKQNVYQLTQFEKAYIFTYNRGRINKGCEKNFQMYKNRKEFLDIQDKILKQYGYKVLQRPKMFTQFYIPSDKRHSSFFERLNKILMYKPLIAGVNGELSLFTTMERSKISFLILKNKFQLHILKQKFGAQIFVPHNNFQKFGKQNQKILGGLDGYNLADRWYPVGIYSDIDTIRNYAGQQVAYIAIFQKYIVSYLLLSAIPFLIIYAFQLAYGQTIFYITSQFQIIMMGVTYQIYLHYWTNAQTAFFNDYIQGRQSKVFLSNFSGPYIRNPVTDEVNQFDQKQGFVVGIIKIISLIVIFALIIIFGAIFHGCKMIIVQLHAQYFKYSFTRLYISLPHLIGYFLFLSIQFTVKRFFIDKFLIKWIVIFNNPPSDEMKSELHSNYLFMYTLFIQLIGPLFYLLFYPYTNTYCYDVSCIQELFFYVYSRYLFLLILLVVKLLNTIYFYVKEVMHNIRKQKSLNNTFRYKFEEMLKQAIKQQKLDQYKAGTLDEQTSLLLLLMFTNIISESSLIVLIANLIMLGRFRLQILYKKQRPLNKSHAIKKTTPRLNLIYMVGLTLNCWANVQTYEYARRYLIFILESFSSRDTINDNKIILIQFFLILANVIIVLIIGKLCSLIADGFNDNTLTIRKINKIKNYLMKIYNSKQIAIIDQPKPLKTIFRTFAPNDENQKQFFAKLQKLELPEDWSAKDMKKANGNQVDQSRQQNIIGSASSMKDSL